MKPPERIYDDGTVTVYSYVWPKGSAQADYIEVWANNHMVIRRPQSQIEAVLAEVESLQHSLSNARTSLRAVIAQACVCVPDHKPMFACPEHGWAATRAGVPA